MIQTKTQRKHLYTPLRYPGGKTSLFEFFSQIIESHHWQNVKYIEPYAGGAGAALSLLMLGRVNSIVINDYDPAIYAFWASVVDDSDNFIYKVIETDTSVEEWRRQKAIYKAADQSDLLELGFATFYLNRTNRSGILNAGPIGGMSQDGEWKIDARYNKDALIQKIRLIQANRDKITVLRKDGIEVINDYAGSEESFFYVDPPYFVKGTDLYLNAFKVKNHELLAQTLNELHGVKWLLTYDSEPEIRSLYAKRNYRAFDLKYSAHHNSRLGSELMIFSDAISMKIVDDL